MLLFLVDLINIENLRILFRFFYSFSFFNFIILRSQATSFWYQSITSIRDQVISVCFDSCSVISNLPLPSFKKIKILSLTSICFVRCKAPPLYRCRNSISTIKSANKKSQTLLSRVSVFLQPQVDSNQIHKCLPSLQYLGSAVFVDVVRVVSMGNHASRLRC